MSDKPHPPTRRPDLPPRLKELARRLVETLRQARLETRHATLRSSFVVVEETMSKEQTSRGRAQDRLLVAGKQDHEVRYEAKKMDLSKEEVRNAVKSEGYSRAKVERKLSED
ncbi:DUF3606 domain-containing protein [Paracoccus benzoatiresistens]|uniref:DUF3606 domain-containing protein n=1 Tax=Paracoccus benzoatiresistens TaxID=2997341 RepID=A0ABT4J9U1_9RHOB|nr:DUF3606 domain-containing protein [Paracoccus sp. EF6]MCZ0963098.1 DUF3606 domain-containing protein [Paracoccus sp. EF6]